MASGMLAMQCRLQPRSPVAIQHRRGGESGKVLSCSSSPSSSIRGIAGASSRVRRVEISTTEWGFRGKSLPERNCTSLGRCGSRKWRRQQGDDFAGLRVFAKQNARQKQPKKNGAPPRPVEKDGMSPAKPVSAPSLYELASESDHESVVDFAQMKSSRDAEESVKARKRENENGVEPRFSAAGVGRAVESIRMPFFPRLGRQIFRRLSSLRLAIGELFVIALLSALGTIIEQNEAPQFYFDNYPEEHPMFGFLSWRVIIGGSLDHIYSSPYYIGFLFLLASSLVACTTTRQFPIVKVARRWSFMKSSSSFEKMQVSETLQQARIGDFATLLMADGFQVFLKGPALYGFKGLAGRYAPIGVHIALLLIMGGATVSAIGGYHGTVMIPQGLGFEVGDVLQPKGILSIPSSIMNDQVGINKFFIDYLPSGAVSQFHTDMTILDSRGEEVYRKTISVNDPLRYHGLTMYQTDWAISALQVRVDGSDPFNLAMASLEKGDNKLYGTFIPVGAQGVDQAKGISILARDLQNVVIYDQEGKFVGVRRPGSGKPILVDGVSLVVEDIIGSSGLELKMDPGVPVVYAGFGALMLTTLISYLSHSQIWALQQGQSLVVGGKSNRAKLEFETQLNQLLDWVPEVKVLPRGDPIRGSDDNVNGNALKDVPMKNEVDAKIVTPNRS